MTLQLADQFTLATTDDAFQNRSVAALFSAAVAKFGEGSLSDPTQQSQRMTMVQAVISDPAKYVEQFKWVLVSLPAVNIIGDLTDAVLVSTCISVFDIISRQIYPATITRAVT